MKKYLLLTLTILMSVMIFAQTTQLPGRVFYVEAGGPGIGLSANYDWRLNPMDRLGPGFRVGFGIRTDVNEEWDEDHGFWTNQKAVLTIPFGVNHILGTQNDHRAFEIGLTFIISSVKMSPYTFEEFRKNSHTSHINGSFSAMYRIAPFNGGFTFRAGITPVFNFHGDASLFRPAIGIGHTF